MTSRAQRVKAAVCRTLRHTYGLTLPVSVRAAGLGDTDRRPLILIRHPLPTEIIVGLRFIHEDVARIYCEVIAEKEIAA